MASSPAPANPSANPQGPTHLEPIFRSPLAQQLLPDAKHARISRWRSEVDPSDVVCGCSRHLELSRSSRAPEACTQCGKPEDSEDQRQRKHAGAGGSSASGAGRKTGFSIRRFFRRPARDDRGSDATDSVAYGSGGLRSKLSLHPLPKGSGAGGTQMYRQDEADDEASSASSEGGLSDSAKGKGKPKLGVDDSAARLRRAQKLLNAQGKAKA